MNANDISELKTYLTGVMNRSVHHANGVRATVLTLAGAVVFAHDPAMPLQIRTHGDTLANVIWFGIGGQRYCLAYNHKTGNVEMRVGTMRGDVFAEFNDGMPAEEIRQLFADLML